MKGRLLNFSLGYNGKQLLLLELDGDFREDYDRLSGREVDVDIKRHREKRSLDANGYAWALIDKISAKMKLPKEQVYKDHIKSIGGVSEVVCVRDKAVAKLQEKWQKNGLGWQAEPFPSKIAGCTNVTLYYGSSTYDTTQMSMLIDSLIETARSIGIETMSKEELDSMVGKYGRV